MFSFNGELNAAGWFHLAYFGVLIPILWGSERDRSDIDKIGCFMRTWNIPYRIRRIAVPWRTERHSFVTLL